MGTKAKPGQFDCHAAALENEEIFTLRAKDPSFNAVVRYWAMLRAQAIERGEKPASDHALITEALECAEAGSRWREEYLATIKG